MNATEISERRKSRTYVIVAVVVLAWFAVAEGGSQAWYLAHESHLPRNPVPASGEEIVKRIHTFADGIGSEITEREVGATAMEMLKCSYGKTLFWADPYGTSALTVLKWDERSVVGGVDSMHNPGQCLKAAGWTVGDKTSLGVQEYCKVTSEVTRWDVSQGGIKMQAYSAVFRRYSDTKAEQNSVRFWQSNRLRSVLSGRRDAPVLIMLAYLPTSGDEERTDARFGRIMKDLFCDEPSR